MNIAVIGAGYVGLVAGSCFAESGNDVVCVDSNAERIANLRKAVIPIYEPGLPELIERNMRDERLSFTTDLAAAVKRSLVIFVAVGTPTMPDGAADLSAVFAVAEQIGMPVAWVSHVVHRARELAALDAAGSEDESDRSGDGRGRIAASVEASRRSKFH